ncbi:MAG: hypothetical protein GY755_07780 [Chloroflexi bacterium]|nr:hypothetical protein [Chloroflexota bacterium]
MKTNPGMKVLFEEEPSQWGYRGDPYLWRELEHHFESIEIPKSLEECEAMISSAFETITKGSIEGDSIRIEQFDNGGMSGGMISTVFWRERAIPLLLSRYRLLQE